MRIVAGVLAVLLLVGAACDPEPGTIELRNESDDHLVWIAANRQALDDLLRSSDSWVTVTPGKTRKKTIAGGSQPDWCDPPRTTHFLLRTLDGQRLDGSNPDTPVSVTLADFEIVAEVGPGRCWGDRNAVWTYTGR